MTLRAEEGDEAVEEQADEAAKTKKGLNESTKMGKQVREEADSGKRD